MNGTDLVAGILSDAEDPQKASKGLLNLLLSESPTSSSVHEAGFSPELFEILLRRLPKDPSVLAIACACGAAWVDGRRSATQGGSWEPVISLPPDEDLPQGIRRGTAETIISMMMRAHQFIRMTAPFFYSSGFVHLVEPLTAAASRGVEVELFLLPDEETENGVKTLLDKQGMNESTRKRVTTHRVESEPWPHLKVVIVDGSEAYVGSANITRRALKGENLELGVLLNGPQVSAIDRVLDLLKHAEESS